jgi:hypothetical protein
MQKPWSGTGKTRPCKEIKANKSSITPFNASRLNSWTQLKKMMNSSIASRKVESAAVERTSTTLRSTMKMMSMQQRLNTQLTRIAMTTLRPSLRSSNERRKRFVGRLKRKDSSRSRSKPNARRLLLKQNWLGKWLMRKSSLHARKPNRRKRLCTRLKMLWRSSDLENSTRSGTKCNLRKRWSSKDAIRPKPNAKPSLNAYLSRTDSSTKRKR